MTEYNFGLGRLLEGAYNIPTFNRLQTALARVIDQELTDPIPDKEQVAFNNPRYLNLPTLARTLVVRTAFPEGMSREVAIERVLDALPPHAHEPTTLIVQGNYHRASYTTDTRYSQFGVSFRNPGILQIESDLAYAALRKVAARRPPEQRRSAAVTGLLLVRASYTQNLTALDEVRAAILPDGTPLTFGKVEPIPSLSSQEHFHITLADALSL